MRARGVLALVLVAAAACGQAATPASAGGCAPRGLAGIGDPIPLSCSFERLDGGRLALSKLVGVPAVINFWASWCADCIREMPALQRTFADLGGRVRFVGADLLGIEGETRSASQTFARKAGARYTLIWDQGGQLYGHFSLRLVAPMTILVDKNGRMAYRKFGPLTEIELRSLLRRYVRAS
jgi:thiol-disulfide isomerase/thioredoxin